MRVTVSGSKSGSVQEASALFSIRVNTGFSIDLSLDKTIYRPGETIVATLSFTSTNATLVQGTMYHWLISHRPTDVILLSEYGAGTGTGSTRSFLIPTDHTGNIDVEVTIYTPDDEVYTEQDIAQVFTSALLVNPSPIYFRPGDRITVNATIVTDRTCAAGEPTFVWSVVPGGAGEAIANGTVSPGSKTAQFSFLVGPDPDSSYSISTTVSCGGLVERDTKGIARMDDVILQIKIPDRSYKPGETVAITWKLIAVGEATVPPVTTIGVWLTGGSDSSIDGSGMSFEVAGEGGTVNYTIPSTAPADADLRILAQGAGSETGTALFTRSGGGAAPASAAASTATWGLVIAVLALFVAVLGFMKKPGAGAAGSDAGSRRSSYDEMKSEAPPKSELKTADVKTDEPPKSL